jgi:hypothetical protein
MDYTYLPLAYKNIVGYAHLQRLFYKVAKEAFAPRISGKKTKKKAVNKKQISFTIFGYI